MVQKEGKNYERQYVALPAKYGYATVPSCQIVPLKLSFSAVCATTYATIIRKIVTIRCNERVTCNCCIKVAKASKIVIVTRLCEFFWFLGLDAIKLSFFCPQTRHKFWYRKIQKTPFVPYEIEVPTCVRFIEKKNADFLASHRTAWRKFYDLFWRGKIERGEERWVKLSLER